MKKNVISIMGPTAVGKTNLSIEIAKKFNGEVISGDSMQVYKGLDIGTAKIKPSEMQGITHHMLDIREADQEFSVSDFKENVQKYINDITARGNLPIIVGGSGLYIQAALYDYNFSEAKRDHTITNKMEEIIESEGIMPLYNRLVEIDPEQAEKIHPNNHRRVIRALEIYESTGMTMTAYKENQSMESPYKPILLGLDMERELLYRRINERVDHMMKDGLLDEVKNLYAKGYENCQSMNAIGYKEFIPYFKNEQSLEETIELLKRNSRRYAKRQLTWFRNKMDLTWFHMTPATIDKQFANILDELAGILK
ncbi:tRNA (adenosine(37)-N6)-dimethylallyltransferase MiaA [Oceanobacillus rekensis]|uniref:tRNA (adenosine(37)-N6)-dimethylallyltransferase MiaA n=1 Tax=Oceanobacillus rekensis TaxID=937927 RepID=UPI000B438646|nr:tRNA (adenosine(37)-N6)-dimethylallyltransferase MiaA [Oceanobacillus rekensis]